MIVDVHAHFVPWKFLDRIKTEARSFPSIERLEQDKQIRLAFAGNPPTRPIAPRLGDAQHRTEWMAAQGIDTQVIGGWLDMFAYEVPAQEGAAWSRLLNEHLLATANKDSPFVPLATVPLQDGALAAAVLAEALDAGFPGAMIGTQPKGAGGTLDDPSLDPFWSVASERGAVVYVHPMYVCGDDRLGDYDLVNAVGRLTDTTIAVTRLLFSGHAKKYPGAKIVLSHAGAALPFALGRLKRNFALSPDKLADPEDGFRRMYFDTVMFDPDGLEFLVKKSGGDRVMLGSDQPFPIGDPKPLDVVRNAALSDATKTAILGETAVQVFRCGCAS
jgi:aminocarboxymuconate-semialdehyde decarboxylase